MAVIETRFLRIAADAASLRDFVERADADMARLERVWPAFAADVRAAVAQALALLAGEVQA